ncbi:MAG: DUF3365 domain-containing protein [Planctomycetaceae bacterium]|nr:DUF3365 domain-containing protein [Planctomycetaceae bacterium]
MILPRNRLWIALALLGVAGLTVLDRIGPPLSADEAPKVAANEVDPLPHAASLKEARGRARLLHESLHSTLQYVHREYYREDEGLKIPAVTLKGVFRDLEAAHKVKIRWLAVNARAMSVDHEPSDDFHKEAIKAIGAGRESFETIEKDVFRYAGAIVLHAECLKCHLPARTSNKPRSAAIVISMPLQQSLSPNPEEK